MKRCCMPKKSVKKPKNRSWEDTYDLPPELDFRKLRVVGVGLDALRDFASKRRKPVRLAPDVARDFPTSEAVNEALRLVQQIRQLGKNTKRRKSA